MQKLPVARVKDITPGDHRFWVGRVTLTQQPLIAPVSNYPCAYYEAFVEHYVKYETHTTDENGNTHSQTNYRWDPLFTEQKCSDFILSDPEGTPCYVPGGQTAVKFYTQVTAGGGSGGNSFFEMTQSNLNPHLEAMLQRHGHSSFSFFGQGKKLRYREGIFSVNEVVAILGTASAGNIQGCPIAVLSPCRTEILDQAWFEKNQWDEVDQKCWAALTRNASFIGTDDPAYMRGITIPTLIAGYSACAFAAPVQFYGAPMMQQQPMMMQQQPMMMQQQPMMQQQQPMMMQQQQPMMQQQQPMMMQQQQQPMMMQQQQQPMMSNPGQIYPSY